MKLLVSFHVDNDAFRDEEGGLNYAEIDAVLDQAKEKARELTDARWKISLIDSNGNIVGNISTSGF